MKNGKLTGEICALIFGTVFGVCATNAATSTESTTQNVGPKIVLAEPYFDFGRIPADKIVSHDFVVTNVGNRVLTISDVRSSCGCTTATNWNHEIKPGQTG